MWIRRFHRLVLMVALPRYDRQMAINNLDHMLVCVCVVLWVLALMCEYERTHTLTALHDVNEVLDTVAVEEVRYMAPP